MLSLTVGDAERGPPCSAIDQQFLRGRSDNSPQHQFPHLAPGLHPREPAHQDLERLLPAGRVYAVNRGHRKNVGLQTPMISGGRAHGCQRDGRPVVEGDAVLGLLGFYDEIDNRPGQPNGSLRDAVQPVGEPDEADLVAYLDAGHILIDVMEGGRDVITGSAHRHSLGCSSLVTDGTWLWRQDFPHYVETHHVLLPEAFIEHARDLNYQMPALVIAQFAPHFNETMPLVGWAATVPWRSTAAVLEPEPRTVTTKVEFDAAMLAQERNRPHGNWAKPRKPRRA